MKIHYYQTLVYAWCFVLATLISFPGALQAASISNSVTVQSVTGGQNGVSGQDGADGQDGARGAHGQSVTAGVPATYSEVMTIIDGVMTGVTTYGTSSATAATVTAARATDARVVTYGFAQADEVVLSDEQRYEELSKLLASIQLILMSYVTHIF